MPFVRRFALAVLLLAAAATTRADTAFQDQEPPADVAPAALEAYKRGKEALKALRTSAKDFYANADKATTAFEEALKLSTNHSKATPEAQGLFRDLITFNLAIGYQMTMEFKKAEDLLRQMLVRRPSFPAGMTELADVYAWQKKYPEALRWYENALKVDAEFYNANQNRGLIYMKITDYARARPDLQKAQEIAGKQLASASTDEEKKEWSGRQQMLDKMLKLLDQDAKGPSWPKAYKKETAHYVIQTDVSQEVCDYMAEEAENVYKLYVSYFGTPPGAAKFPIYIFGKDPDYFGFGGQPNTGGFYNPFVKKLVVRGRPSKADNLIVLYHEGFHQFLDYFIEQPPQWFNEGFGDFFGPLEIKGGAKGFEFKPNPWRLPLIKAAIAQNAVKSFPEITMLVKAELYDRKTVGVNYAQAWSMIYFMMMAKPQQNYPYRQILNNYYNALLKGQGAQAAYAASFGRVNVEALEKEWRDFILKL